MQRGFSIFSLGLLAAIVLTACGSDAAEVSLDDYGAPLRITVSAEGDISLSVTGDDAPPALLETVAAGSVSAPAQTYGVPQTLTIRLAEQDHIYDLGANKFRFELEALTYEAVTFTPIGPDWRLDLAPGTGSALPLSFVPMDEEADATDVLTTLHLLEIRPNEVRIHVTVHAYAPHTWDPWQSCIYRDKSMLEVDKFNPMNTDTTIATDTEFEGTLIFARGVFQSGKKHTFSYECIGAHIELPF